MNMIERVAMAIAKSAAEADLVDENWQAYVADARAAIAAMREPSEEMIIAGKKAELDKDQWWQEEIWVAMIDEALRQ